jgi:hypothetical protein
MFGGRLMQRLADVSLASRKRAKRCHEDGSGVVPELLRALFF